MHYSPITVAAFAAGVLAVPATKPSPTAIIADGIPIVPTILPSLPLGLLTPPSPAKGITLPSPITKGKNPLPGLLSLDVLGLIENSACDLTQNLAPLENLTPLFGVSQFLGEIVGPILNETVGFDFTNDIDATADQLCVSAQQDKPDGLGVCQTVLAALFDLSNSVAGKLNKQQGVSSFKCFLSLACVAPTGFEHTGTCQELLAGSDCIANRIIDAEAPECCPKGKPNCNKNPTNTKPDTK